MKATFVIASMEAGGAERVLSILANHWAEKGWDITLLTFTDGPSFFPLHPAINFCPLGILDRSPLAIQRFLDNFKRLWILRKAIRKSNPLVVVSFLDQINVHTLIATLGLKIPVIVSERSDPEKDIANKFWEVLRRMTYTSAEKVVSVTNSGDRYFYWLPEAKRRVIHNPVSPVKDDSDENSIPKGLDPARKWILAMGRLVPTKGYDLLLSAYQSIVEKYSDWQLIILGEGELRPELENLRQKLGLQDQVVFPGCITNPFPVLMKSKLFVMSSRYEGFANSLAEAMACGLPAVSFDCPGGPGEIIRHGIDGILVPAEDVSELADALDRLMGDEKERKRLALKAPEVVERFSKEKILGKWEDVILKSVQ